MLARQYGWTPEYILKKLTWSQVMAFYNHERAWNMENLEYYDKAMAEDSDEPPPPLEMPGVEVTKEGHRIYNR
jgi:hypothetical protein